MSSAHHLRSHCSWPTRAKETRGEAYHSDQGLETTAEFGFLLMVCVLCVCVHVCVCVFSMAPSPAFGGKTMTMQ